MTGCAHLASGCRRRVGRALGIGLWLGFSWLLGSAAPGLAASAPADGDSAAALRQALVQTSARRPAAAIERAQFLWHPAVTQVELAPDGNSLAFLLHTAQRTDLMLELMATGERQRLLADVADLEFVWAGDSQSLWIADGVGLSRFDRRADRAKRLIRWNSRLHHRFLGVDERAPDYALVGERALRDGHSVHRILRIDGVGSIQPLIEAAQPVHKVLLDAAGQLRFSAGLDGPQYDSVVREHRAGGVVERLRCHGIEHCRLLGFDDADSSVWVLSQQGEDRIALQRWRADTQDWETVHRDPVGVADAEAVLWQSQPPTWRGIAYHSDHLHWYGADARSQAQLSALQQKLPQANLRLSASADGQRWLVVAERADAPDTKDFLYTPASHTLNALFTDAAFAGPAMLAGQLAAAVPISYRASDGMRLHGYVYLPPGLAPGRVPLIARVHGGPFNRDRDDYDPLLQLMVNRGYAVFTPNFRGSTGFGLRYLRSANGEFGNGRVLGDILDGLDYLLQQGVGDPERQAIIGHSFGGYAGLLAATHRPGRFRFAMASAAPVEFGWNMRWIADNGGSGLPEQTPPAEVFFRRLGLPLSDPGWLGAMREDSPLSGIDQLGTPIYLWAGARDDRVPLKTIGRYAAEVNRRKLPITLLIDPESGHSTDTDLQFEAVLYLAEAAAHKHLGGALSPASPALLRLLKRNARLDSNELGLQQPAGPATDHATSIRPRL